MVYKVGEAAGGRRRGGGEEDDTEKEKEKGEAADRKPCNCQHWFGEKYMKNTWVHKNTTTRVHVRITK